MMTSPTLYRTRNVILTLFLVTTVASVAFQYIVIGLIFLGLLVVQKRQGGKALVIADFAPIFLTSIASFLLILFTVAATSSSPGDIPGNIWESRHYLGKVALYGPLMLWIVHSLHSLGLNLATRPMKYFIILLGVYAIYMTIQRYTGIDWVHGFGATLPDRRATFGVFRASGFMDHPLHLAFNLLTLFALFTSLLIRSHRNRWHLVALMLTFVCIWLTGSRWPLMVALVLLGYLLYSKFNKAICALILAAIVVLLASDPKIKGRMDQIISSPERLEQAIPRVQFWKIHTAMFLDKPLVGVGYVNRQIRAIDYYNDRGYTDNERKYSAHNIYLQSLADSGLLGLAALLLPLYGYLRFAKARGVNGATATIVLGTAFLAGLMQNTFRDTEYVFCFWLCSAILTIDWQRTADGNGTGNQKANQLGTDPQDSPSGL